MSGKVIRVLVAVVLLSFVLAACGSKVNQTNFDKIKIGMTEDEVKAILGPPTEVSSMNMGIFSGNASKWTSKNGTIVVQFFNGKVQIKEFSKPPK